MYCFIVLFICCTNNIFIIILLFMVALADDIISLIYLSMASKGFCVGRRNLS